MTKRKEIKSLIRLKINFHYLQMINNAKTYCLTQTVTMAKGSKNFGKIIGPEAGTVLGRKMATELKKTVQERIDQK
jgi:hypothetical protein